MGLAEVCHSKTHKHTSCQLQKEARRKVVSDSCSYSAPERPPHGLRGTAHRDPQATFPRGFCLQLFNSTMASMIETPVDKKHIWSSADDKSVETS